MRDSGSATARGLSQRRAFADPGQFHRHPDAARTGANRRLDGTGLVGGPRLAGGRSRSTRTAWWSVGRAICRTGCGCRGPGAIFDFDLGTGLDDEAIEFPIPCRTRSTPSAPSSPGDTCRCSPRAAEWMVTGDPLTPETVQLHRQTRVGSPVDRRVPPRDVEGATVFVAAQRPPDPRVPVRRHRAGLPRRRPDAARRAHDRRPDRSGLRPGAPAPAGDHGRTAPPRR